MAFRKCGLSLGVLGLSMIVAGAQVSETTNAPGAPGSPTPAPSVNPLPSTNLPPGKAPPPSATPDESQGPPPGSDAKAYVDFGIDNGRKGNLDGAIAAFATAIKLDPKYSPAYYNQGFAYLLQNKTDEAIANFNQVISLSPNFRDAYYHRGCLYGEKGDFDAASRDFLQVVKIDPHYAPAHYQNGHVLYFRGNLSGASEEMDNAIRINADSPYPYFIRGLIRNVQGRRLDALGDFQKSFGLGYAAAAFWVWAMQNESGLAEGAKQDLTSARAKPDKFQPGAWPTHIADFLLGKLSEDQMVAKAKTDNADDTAQQTCQAWFYAGMARRVAGDEPGARAAFTKAVATGSKSSEEFVEAQRILAGKE